MVHSPIASFSSSSRGRHELGIGTEVVAAHVSVSGALWIEGSSTLLTRVLIEGRARIEIDAAHNRRAALARWLVGGICRCTTLIFALTLWHEDTVILAARARRGVIVWSSQETRRASIETNALHAHLSSWAVLEETRKGWLSEELIRAETANGSAAEVRRAQGRTACHIRPFRSRCANHSLVAAGTDWRSITLVEQLEAKGRSMRIR